MVDGLHFLTGKAGELLGVPAMAYLVEHGNKRWLFPGDTRNYLSEMLPSFGPVDLVFAHLWLGRRCALKKSALLINEFCQFYVDLSPRRIIITHLREFGRDANDFWDLGHVKLIQSRLMEMAPEIEVSFTMMGQGVNL